MREKIDSVLVYLGRGLIERDDALKIILLAVLAGENAVLLGPPGTGKSLMARRVSEVLEMDESEVNYFEYLLTKFSTPDEIFGPLSIAELKADRFRRSTDNYLPSVKLAFLDEIFKSNSSILNALLTILNERLYHNGSETQKVPLRALIAASNEVPTEQEELAALYDRFLLRGYVDYVSSSGFDRLFETSNAQPELEALTVQELESIERGSSHIVIPQKIIKAISQIWQAHREEFKEDRRETLSDRRLKKVVKLLKVSAFTNGRTELDLSDVFLLKNCLWNHPDNAAKVRELVLDVLRGFTRLLPVESDTNGGEPAIQVGGSGTGEMNVVVKGLRGQGIETDPLLIGSVEDLVDLARPEVGQQGYYFRQVSDLDCSNLSSWPKILFCGHYDGGRFTVVSKHNQLFTEVLAGSTIMRLRLSGVGLAHKISGSEVSYCTSDSGFIRERAKNTQFTGVVTEGGLVVTNFFRPSSSDAVDCIINRCKSIGSVMVPNAFNCQFIDCVRDDSQKSKSSSSASGAIVRNLRRHSVISGCIVGGVSFFGSDSGGIVDESGKETEIKNSFLAHCDANPANRIVRDWESTHLVNNAAIGTLPGTDDPNGKDGRTVDPTIYGQRFFESTLGWDFKHTWFWDDTNKVPTLRNIGFDADSVSHSNESAGLKEGGVDLLTKQICENLWL